MLLSLTHPFPKPYALLELSDDPNYEEIIAFVIRSNQALVTQAESSQSWNISLGSGRSEPVFLNLRLYEITNDPQFLRHAQCLLRKYQGDKLIAYNNEYSFWEGLSGLLYLLIKLQGYLRDDILLRALNSIVQRLLEQLQVNTKGTFFLSSRNADASRTGLRHGNCGIAFAFIELTRFSGNPIFFVVARHLLLYEECQWQEKIAACLANDGLTTAELEERLAEYLEFAIVCYLFYHRSNDTAQLKVAQETVANIRMLTGRELASEDTWEEIKALDPILRPVETSFPLVSEIERNNISPATTSDIRHAPATPDTKSALNIDLKTYNEIVAAKRFERTLKAFKEKDPPKVDEFLQTNSPNPYKDFVEAVDLTFLKYPESLKNIFHFEKAKSEWAAKACSKSTKEEEAFVLATGEYLLHEDRDNVPLVFHKDTFFLSLEEYINLFDVDPEDRATIAKMFISYGTRSWLFRRGGFGQVHVENLTFFRIVADQFLVPSSVSHVISRTTDYFFRLNKKSRKMIERGFLYKEQDDFKTFFGGKLREFIRGLLYGGFLTPHGPINIPK
ncbi:hypothetical protein GCM10011511_00110 [Puia dinghuensis]|uniref:Uncharacterized protein n=2 Tax=Puia dinghuensis TaxID=1792502 RepID=A0A8J2U6B3_9BACT|nr:hypothetical protein GCM10011511_00110 [Puia dinghuensis]